MKHDIPASDAQFAWFPPGYTLAIYRAKFERRWLQDRGQEAYKDERCSGTRASDILAPKTATGAEKSAIGAKPESKNRYIAKINSVECNYSTCCQHSPKYCRGVTAENRPISIRKAQKTLDGPTGTGYSRTRGFQYHVILGS